MFDARAAKALAAGDHLTIGEAPGLRLVAGRTTRSWVYRYKSPEDGRMRQIKLGAWPAMSFAGALVAWETARRQRESGVDLAMNKRAGARARAQKRSPRYTVRDACDDYLAAYTGTVTEKTYWEAERLLRLELGKLADMPAADITRSDAFDLIDSKRAKPVVATRLRQLLGAVWDRGLDAGRIPESSGNWWRMILRGKLRSRGKVVDGKNVGAFKRALSEAELAQLIPWLPNFTRDVEDALTLYLWTCCRGAEILAMERSEIVEEGDGLWWTIPRAKQKMRRNEALSDLRVPLVGRADLVVRRRLASHDDRFVFPGRSASGHIEQKVIGVAVWTHRPECASRPEWSRPRTPVTNWTPHDLRRTSRTVLASIGCPDAIAEAILGHLPPGIVGVYNLHQYDAERRDWLTRLSDRFEQIAARGPAQARTQA